MDRFTIKTTVIKTENPWEHSAQLRLDSVIEKTAAGEWVRWADVERLREELEAQIPEKRIERLERALGLVHEGKCPKCEQMVRGYKAPSGGFAPEAYATYREAGIDPSTGHLKTCGLA